MCDKCVTDGLSWIASLCSKESMLMERGSRFVTLDDLEKFRTQLLFDFQQLLQVQLGNHGKKWLKSHEVKELLRISHCTLQSLRSSGKLPFTKIGGVMYYDFQDVQEMLAKNKIIRKNKSG